MKLKILVLVWLLFLIAGSARAYDDGDLQVWNTDTEEFNINKDSKIALEEEFRWGDNVDQFYYHHYDASCFHSINKYLSIGGGYRQVFELKKGKFMAEDEPYLAASLLWGMAGVSFEDRSRMEYRHFAYQADSGRYRNKITMKLPWKFTSLKIQPYVSDEGFFSLGGTNMFNQNRFCFGLGVSLAKNVKGEIYYMLQDTRSPGDWVDTNVLGTKLKIVF
ncbi:MAG: DUF2490 domain-containing protein [Candidatus Omnitrophica bacterium]|nr:DUF2490 domain-containing protein [Candidatus Omnitrophota bacterium]